MSQHISHMKYDSWAVEAHGSFMEAYLRSMFCSC